MSLWTCFWKHWWLPLLALLLLWAVMHFLGGKKESIPADVKQRVVSQLAGGGYDGIDVDVDGRDVTLTGIAASETARDEILSLARSTVGAKDKIAPRVVNWAGDIKAAEPAPAPVVKAPTPVLRDPSLNATVKDGIVTLRGQLGSQQQIDAVVASAYARFGGADNVVNQLTLGDNLKPVKGLNGLLSGVDINNGSLSLAGKRVTIRGEVESNEVMTAASVAVGRALGSDFRVNNRLTVAAPAVPAQNLVCQRELTSVMSQSKIFFETSSAVIKTDSFAVLDQVSGILSQCPEASVAVEGHTDSSGDEAMNQNLSERRAQSVVSYLVGKGVNQSNLSSVGFGESKPVASNADREGRAKNRRIEFTVK